MEDEARELGFFGRGPKEPIPAELAGLGGKQKEPKTKAGSRRINRAVGENQWYHFGVGAPPILVYLSGD